MFFKKYQNHIIFLVILLVELALLLSLNSGTFIFALDDPYIHLSLAENIIQGHYGINANEITAPSSSILWPFLISPLTLLPYTPFIIFILNALITLITINYINAILKQHIQAYNSTTLFIFLLLIGNFVGLVFVGMEHTLQVMLLCIIIYYALNEKENKELPLYFWIAIILCPLIRYECFAIVAPLLLVYFFKGYYKETFISGLIISTIIISFSAFLYQNDQHILPNSIIAKSNINLVIPAIFKPPLHLLLNILNPLGWSLVFFTIQLFRTFLKSKDTLALAFASAGFIHLTFGQLWWYGRYETYLLISMALLFLYYRKENTELLLPKKTLALISIPSMIILLSIPIISHAIYAQPYQFAEMLKKYYKKPIGTHDIGLVSYQNENYILDYWGLASRESLDFRLKSEQSDTAWMQKLAKEKNVKLIWLTPGWFKEIPKEWIPVASFSRAKWLILGGGEEGSDYTFYASNASEIAEIKMALKKIEQQLPSSTHMKYFDTTSY